MVILFYAPFSSLGQGCMSAQAKKMPRMAARHCHAFS
jgi:hypothetical protein